MATSQLVAKTLRIDVYKRKCVDAFNVIQRCSQLLLAYAPATLLTLLQERCIATL